MSADTTGAEMLEAAAALRWRRPRLTADLARRVVDEAAAAGDGSLWLRSAGWYLHGRAAVEDARESAVEILTSAESFPDGAGLDDDDGARLRVELGAIAQSNGDIDEAGSLVGGLRAVAGRGAPDELELDRVAVLVRCALARPGGDLEGLRRSVDRIGRRLRAEPAALADLLVGSIHRSRDDLRAATASALSGLANLGWTPDVPEAAPSSPHLAAALFSQWITALLDGGSAGDVATAVRAVRDQQEQADSGRQGVLLRLTIARALPDTAVRTATALRDVADRAARAGAPSLEAACRATQAEVHEGVGEYREALAAMRAGMVAERVDRDCGQRFRDALASVTASRSGITRPAAIPASTPGIGIGSASPAAHGSDGGGRGVDVDPVTSGPGARKGADRDIAVDHDIAVNHDIAADRAGAHLLEWAERSWYGPGGLGRPEAAADSGAPLADAMVEELRAAAARRTTLGSARDESGPDLSDDRIEPAPPGGGGVGPAAEGVEGDPAAPGVSVPDGAGAFAGSDHDGENHDGEPAETVRREPWAALLPGGRLVIPEPGAERPVNGHRLAAAAGPAAFDGGGNGPAPIDPLRPHEQPELGPPESRADTSDGSRDVVGDQDVVEEGDVPDGGDIPEEPEDRRARAPGGQAARASRPDDVSGPSAQSVGRNGSHGVADLGAVASAGGPVADFGDHLVVLDLVLGDRPVRHPSAAAVVQDVVERAGRLVPPRGEIRIRDAVSGDGSVEGGSVEGGAGAGAGDGTDPGRIEVALPDADRVTAMLWAQSLVGYVAARVGRSGLPREVALRSRVHDTTGAVGDGVVRELTGPDRPGPDRPGPDRPGPDRLGEDLGPSSRGLESPPDGPSAPDSEDDLSTGGSGIASGSVAGDETGQRAASGRHGGEVPWAVGRTVRPGSGGRRRRDSPAGADPVQHEPGDAVGTAAAPAPPAVPEVVSVPGSGTDSVDALGPADTDTDTDTVTAAADNAVAGEAIRDRAEGAVGPVGPGPGTVDRATSDDGAGSDEARSARVARHAERRRSRAAHGADRSSGGPVSSDGTGDVDRAGTVDPTHIPDDLGLAELLAGALAAYRDI